MPNIDGLYLIIPKHKHSKTSKGKKKRMQRRVAHGPNELEAIETLAARYAMENGEDYLIVQVVSEFSKPQRGAISEMDV